MRSVLVSHLLSSPYNNPAIPQPHLSSRELTTFQIFFVALLTALATAAPRPTPSSTSAISGEIGFVFYKVPRCGLPGTLSSFTLSQIQVNNHTDCSGNRHRKRRIAGRKSKRQLHHSRLATQRRLLCRLFRLLTHPLRRQVFRRR